VLENPGEATNRIKGVNIVPGPLAEGDSHRCELASLYAMLLVSQAVCNTHNITQGQAMIACDNKQAISMFNEWYVPDPQDANFDLASAIWKLLQDSPIQWRNIHVKGHGVGVALGSPCHNKRGHNISQIDKCPQCLLRISAGLVVPTM